MTDLPPFPTDRAIVLSPKDAEHRVSLGSPMVKAVPSVPFIPQGFTITNISVYGNTITLSWQQGEPPYQVQANNGSAWVDVGLPTTSKTFSTNIDALGKASWFRVQSGVSPVLGDGSFNCPEKIVQMADGRYAYPFSDGQYSKVGFWTGYADFVLVDVPGFSYFRNPHASAVGDRLIITDGTLYGTNRVVEFQVSGNTLTTVTSKGIGLPGVGSSCVVDGRVYCFAFNGETNNQNTIGCLMRQTDGTYKSSTTLVPAPGAIVNARIWTAVGFNGEAWLFGSQDGSQCLSLYRFGANGTMTYTNSCFIQPNQGDLSVSGELPVPTSVVDTINNRILLGYCSWPEDMTCVAFGEIAGRSSVTSVDVGGNLTLLATTPWWSWHFHYPLVCVFPRGPDDLIDCISEHVSGACNVCDGQFDLGTLEKGSVTYGSTVVSGCAGDVVGSSSDGWIVYRDSNSRYRLGKF